MKLVVCAIAASCGCVRFGRLERRIRFGMRRRHRPSEAAAFIRNRLENLFGPLEAMMKKTGLMVLVLSLVVGLMIPAALAQVTGQVKGVCKDVNGKPLAGAIVQWDNLN